MRFSILSNNPFKKKIKMWGKKKLKNGPFEATSML
jgi:hypothetical protein